MKAILVTYDGQSIESRQLVEISDNHDWSGGPYQDTVPFSVGSNQQLVPWEYEEYIHDYAGIADITERRRVFLDDSVAFYSQNPGELRAVDVDAVCVYHPINMSPGCSIGRHYPSEILRDCAGTVYNIDENQFLLWMLEMGRNYLMAVQRLHDLNKFWGEKGLSEDGMARYKDIKAEFGL
jgi:hypothetical protein